MSEIFSDNYEKDTSPGRTLQSIYMRIYYHLINDIMDGRYMVGDSIPTQNELAERFGVSRVTVREAIKELIRRGILVAIKGKGTFVIATPTARGAYERTGGYSSSRYVKFGEKIKSKVIDISVMPANKHLAAELMVPEYAFVTRIMRLRISGTRPACLDDAYLVNRYLNNTNFHIEELESGSLYELLKSKAGIEFDFVEEKMRAVTCSDKVAKYLKIMPGEPVLNIRRRSFDKYGKVIEYCESYERSDMYYTVVQSRRITQGEVAAETYNKLLGCVLGAAVGEALGSITRHLPRDLIKEKFGSYIEDFDTEHFAHDEKRMATVTDGFSLAYFTALELLKSKGDVTKECVQTALLTWSEYPEFMQYAGSITREALQRLKGLAIDDEKQSEKRFITYENDKASNTSAVKVFPVGLINPGNVDKAIEDAATVCMVTHPFDVTISAAAAVAAAVSKAVERNAKLDDVIEAGLYGARAGKQFGEKHAIRLACPSVEKRIELAVQMGRSSIGWEHAMIELGDIIGSGKSTTEVVPCAFGILAASPGSIMQCIKMGVNIGYDTDRIATIVGAIAGALYGIQTIPMKYLEWINTTNGFDLERLAYDLAATYYVEQNL